MPALEQMPLWYIGIEEERKKKMSFCHSSDKLYSQGAESAEHLASQPGFCILIKLLKSFYSEHKKQ